tara:strand:+ start:7295 stop:7507 length:213 start_codon:yes stop_codon:yes gene_type:complete
MSDGININVDSPNVTAPVSVNLSGTSIVDSVRNGLNEFVDHIKKGSDEALTVVFLGVMFFTAGLYFWRRV